MNELFTLPVLLGVLYSGVRLATPYLYAALGEMFAQRSGVVNLGVDGIMLMGAFTAFFIVTNTGSLALGMLGAMVIGLLMGLLMSFVSVNLRAVQGISGIVAALFGKLHPLGAIPASVLFGSLLVGADKMQRAVQVPSALIDALNGLVVLFVVGSDVLVRRRAQRRREQEPHA